MADADVVSCCLHGFLCSICCRYLSLGMEELELHCRRRGRYNFPKIKIATMSVRMVNKEDRAFFLGDNSVWSFPSVSSLSGYSVWGS